MEASRRNRVDGIAASRVTLSPNVRHLDLPRRRRLGADFGVTVVAGAPVGADGGGECFVVGATAKEGAQVVAGAGEEAEIELAVGGEAGAGGARAGRARGRGEGPQLARAGGGGP